MGHQGRGTLAGSRDACNHLVVPPVRVTMPRILLCLLPLLPLFATSCDSLDDENDIAGLIASQFVTIMVDEADLASGTLTSDTAVDSQTFLANIREKMGSIKSVE